MDDTSLFSEVNDFEVDMANRLWVYDYQGRRLFLFDSTGRLVRRIGRQGAGPGEFAQGNGMVALADTGIAFLDAQNSRISFFTSSGDFRTSIPVPSGFNTTNGLITDRSFTLYLRRPVTPPREGEILGRMGLVRLDSTGTFVDSPSPRTCPSGATRTWPSVPTEVADHRRPRSTRRTTSGIGIPTDTSWSVMAAGTRSSSLADRAQSPS